MLFGKDAPDGFRVKKSHEYAEIHQQISAVLVDQEDKLKWPAKLKDIEVGQSLLEGDTQQRRRVLFALTERIREAESGYQYLLRQCFVELLRADLPLDEPDYFHLAETILPSNTPSRYASMAQAGPAVLKALSRAEKRGLLSERILGLVHEYVTILERDTTDAKQIDLCNLLLKRVAKNPLSPIEPWAKRAISQIRILSALKSEAWIVLLCHCELAKNAKPTAKWRKQALLYLAQVGADSFHEHLTAWLPLVDKPRKETKEEASSPHIHDAGYQLLDHHQNILRGLVWLAGMHPAPETTRCLGGLTITTFRKLKGQGPRAPRIANACLWSLGLIGDDQAVGQLALLKIKVKLKSAQNQIAKALAVTAEQLGITPMDLEEMSVPTYGMTEVGIRRLAFGELTAELRVAGTSQVNLSWIKPDGKRQKSIPAAVKKDLPDQLKSLRADIADLKKMLPAQRNRIDTLYLEQRSWDLATWRERYLDHPLIGTIARRLIWSFEDGDQATSATWLDDESKEERNGEEGASPPGGLVDENGQAFQPSASTTISLWHPVQHPVEHVLAWREFMESRSITQPFKQAHREVYLLTDAERTTGTYSNRFAAHVLKQHQFHALCAQRNWRNVLRLMVDDEYEPATRELQAWGLRAELWVEGACGDHTTDLTDSGSYLYLTTDQVRFYPIDGPKNRAHAGGGGYTSSREDAEENVGLELAQVPPLVLSEVMRDVDLFVGVASIGNDPGWLDGGPGTEHRDYWTAFSFAELSGSAKSRRELFESLVPKLAIADRCSLSDRFLVVRGDLRTYKIHLGSGNILMDPGDQYLCIVPARSKAAEKIYLPFEGDNRTAMILSKALLLAADTKIKDQLILSQIGRS
jgi:hypothetical protein